MQKQNGPHAADDKSRDDRDDKRQDKREDKSQVQVIARAAAILRALEDVQMVGRDLESTGEFTGGGTRVPALKIGRFNFSGASDH